MSRVNGALLTFGIALIVGGITMMYYGFDFDSGFKSSNNSISAEGSVAMMVVASGALNLALAACQFWYKCFQNCTLRCLFKLATVAAILLDCAVAVAAFTLAVPESSGLEK